MFSSAVLLAAAAFQSLNGLASAQNGSATCAYSTSGNLTFDPNCVDLSLRQAWCLGERNTCRQVCPDEVTSADGNTCDPNLLTYGCTCQDGSSPNMTDYQQSLPAALCRQWVIYCTAAHPNDIDGQAACQSVVCGEKLANDTTSTSSSSGSASTTSAGSGGSASTSGASTTTSGSASESTSASGSAASASSTGAATALRMGGEYGLPVLGAGLLALFGLAL